MLQAAQVLKVALPAARLRQAIPVLQAALLAVTRAELPAVALLVRAEPVEWAARAGPAL